MRSPWRSLSTQKREGTALFVLHALDRTTDCSIALTARNLCVIVSVTVAILTHYIFCYCTSPISPGRMSISQDVHVQSSAPLNSCVTLRDLARGLAAGA